MPTDNETGAVRAVHQVFSGHSCEPRQREDSPEQCCLLARDHDRVYRPLYFVHAGWRVGHLSRERGTCMDRATG